MIRWVLGELWTNRFRMGLVALGVLWGTLSLASLLAFGGEMARAISVTSSNFGVDLLRISGGSTTRPWQGRGPGQTIRLDVGDAADVRQVPGVRGAVIEHSHGQTVFRAGTARHTGGLSGVEAEFGLLRSRFVLDGGRFLSELDERDRRRVCYLGSGAAAGLFGDRDAIGQEIEVLGTRFKVVGVGPEFIQISDYNGRDSNKVYVPAATLRGLTGVRQGTLVVGLEDASQSVEVQDAIYAALGAKRGFDPSDRAALQVQDYVVLQERIGSIVTGNRVLTAFVGVLGFLVAALGIANATWAHVEEKRREIALAMALGARRVHVMLPPLMEASLTAIVGGGLGLAIAAVVFAAAATLDVPAEARAYLGTPSVSLPLGALIVLLLTVAGMLSGWLPAKLAASVNPVEALRDE